MSLFDRETLRWRIVNLIDRLPGQCWSDLADWAGRWFADDEDEESQDYGLPWRPISSRCREDLRNVGSCYCGKLKGAPEPETARKTS